MIINHWIWGYPIFRQTHNCCQIRELLGCWSPWTRWKKAGIGQLFDVHAKCHWNWKYIYIYITTNQTKYPPVIKHGLLKKSAICSWFSHSNPSFWSGMSHHKIHQDRSRWSCSGFYVLARLHFDNLYSSSHPGNLSRPRVKVSLFYE